MLYFLGVKKKVTRENLTKILDFGREKKSTREKKWKTPKKYPWKSFFARENFRKFTPVKMIFCAREKKSKIMPVKIPKVHVKIVTIFF